jgi:hypothetical protein
MNSLDYFRILYNTFEAYIMEDIIYASYSLLEA